VYCVGFIYGATMAAAKDSPVTTYLENGAWDHRPIVGLVYTCPHLPGSKSSNLSLSISLVLRNFCIYLIRIPELWHIECCH
jgi:hypothetical protein